MTFILVLLSAFSAPAAEDDRIRLPPQVSSAKEFAVTEQRAQKRVTIVEQTRQRIEVVQPLPAVREVEDDWFVLLDVAPKKSGIFQKDFNVLHPQNFLVEVNVTL